MTTNAHDALKVAVTFNPAPPRKGSETITVMIKDAHGKPVKGATVKIASRMPSMSMGGPTLAARETTAGTYPAKANLTFATTWVFDVSASAGSKSGHARVSADVK
jgi:nitrogen fixation protein FixH